MAGYQGELIIIKSERAESFSYGGRGQEIRWNIIFVLSSYPFALSTATWKWVTRIMIEALVTECNCLEFQSLSYSHSPFAVNLKSLYQLGHLVSMLSFMKHYKEWNALNKNKDRYSVTDPLRVLFSINNIRIIRLNQIVPLKSFLIFVLFWLKIDFSDCLRIQLTTLFAYDNSSSWPLNENPVFIYSPSII